MYNTKSHSKIKQGNNEHPQACTRTQAHCRYVEECEEEGNKAIRMKATWYKKIFNGS